jgi:hypothetical protein
MSSILQNRGIHQVELESPGNWSACGDRESRFEEPKAPLLEVPAALGARHTKATPDTGGNDWPPEHLVESSPNTGQISP